MPRLKSMTTLLASCSTMGKVVRMRRAGRSLVTTKPSVASYKSTPSWKSSNFTILPDNPVEVAASDCGIREADIRCSLPNTVRGSTRVLLVPTLISRVTFLAAAWALSDWGDPKRALKRMTESTSERRERTSGKSISEFSSVGWRLSSGGVNVTPNRHLSPEYLVRRP